MEREYHIPYRGTAMECLKALIDEAHLAGYEIDDSAHCLNR